MVNKFSLFFNVKNRNAVYEARDRGRSHGKTEGAAKRRKGRRFLAKQGKIYHGAAAGYWKLPPERKQDSGK